MRIALPTAGGQVCPHFGHCQTFAIIEVDPGTRAVRSATQADPPEHAPGVLPRWLAEAGVDLVIAGGMGRRAQDLFRQYGIQVLVGAPSGDPEEVVRAYLEGSLEAGENICEH